MRNVAPIFTDFLPQFVVMKLIVEAGEHQGHGRRDHAQGGVRSCRSFWVREHLNKQVV